MLRRCLLPPIPAHDLAANLLSQAADAILRRDFADAADLLRDSDLRPLEEHRNAVAGPINLSIHRRTKLPVFQRPLEERGRRMPTAAVGRGVLARDGYRCRFCGARTIVAGARKAFVKALPEVVRWGPRNKDCHFGLAVLAASIDHVVPFERGGTSDLDNLVTACNPCQYGRGQFLLEELDLEDPRAYAPLGDSWDGLTRLLPHRNTAL